MGTKNGWHGLMDAELELFSWLEAPTAEVNKKSTNYWRQYPPKKLSRVTCPMTPNFTPIREQLVHGVSVQPRSSAVSGTRDLTC